MSDTVNLRIGAELFRARLRYDLAPRSCERLLSLLPYGGHLIHARWSGEALWAPLGGTLPMDPSFRSEHPRAEPIPGEILLYAGSDSEPELYLPYGINRFACKVGPLAGSPVLSIEQGLERLIGLGRHALWKGAFKLSIEVQA